MFIKFDEHVTYRYILVNTDKFLQVNSGLIILIYFFLRFN